MGQINIVIVDDHKMVRQGIKMLLQVENDFRIIGEADNGFSALQLIYSQHPDVIVTDLAMQGMTGIELCRQVRKCLPQTQCVILSMYSDEPYVKEALNSGAKGYVLKENSVDDLVQALREVTAGRIFISPSLVNGFSPDPSTIFTCTNNKLNEKDRGLTLTALKSQVEELRRMAFVDQLTGVGNRHYAEISLRTKSDEFTRYGWPFGVILIDIDNFKLVNDTYGHETGDKALQVVADIFSQNTRNSSSFFYRWGGDEFLLISSNVNDSQLLDISERTRLLVAGSNVSGGVETVRVTVSAGVAMARMNENPQELIRRADKMLYVSKKEGKNRSTVQRERAAL